MKTSKDLEDFVIKRSSDFVEFEEVERFESLQYDERDDFIAIHKN